MPNHPLFVNGIVPTASPCHGSLTLPLAPPLCGIEDLRVRLERPGESLYEKESRKAEEVLAKERAARKTSARRRKYAQKYRKA